ncbi:MFS transporter [Shimia biformata]|uniref:MFS transporter n=1 Tax=Shimia biformata TaxID=1294299 RepID=UPI001EF2F0E1|nr:MFS transporter [Shimia biformata]
MQELDTPSARRVWWAVTGMFALNGGLFGIWASRIPAIKDRFQLEHSTLGLLLLLLGVGAILSFPLAGRLSDRFGAARVSRWLGLANAVSLLAIAFSPSLFTLPVALFMFGATHGAMDVAMNAWAAESDRVHKRADMPVFHAMWSLGAGVGAASGALAAWLDAAPQPHFLIAGGVLTATCLALAAIPWVSAASPQKAKSGLHIPTGPLLLVGLLTLCSTLGEGAMADWSAVYLRDVTLASDTVAAAGYAVFSATMVGTRLSGAFVTRILGPIRAMRVSGVIALVGVVLMVVISTPMTALAGLVCLGLGYSLVVPLAFTRAANDPELPQAQAIARVATLSYGGMLMGPPTIGFIAHALGLPAAFSLLGLLAIVTITLAPVLRPPE